MNIEAKKLTLFIYSKISDFFEFILNPKNIANAIWAF
jgi:hypothetical protein